MLNFFTGRQHQFGALVLMRGETFIETIEEGGMAVLVLLRGTASVSRQRAGAHDGISPQRRSLAERPPGVADSTTRTSVPGAML